ncbi:trimeric intracellular cation channel family protein [Corynebacterium testudinoris]|uniref:Putative membrane protein n=1 Tax=Corynebacterium testudinoris TaxID=136857 RepID=A0A0G3H3L6_9CORY|nr:trimeric intracellular cation channel family protein [Corynebacterium testudinoris]AKK07994.1 putative membrane protein [Corynebacterium testudinoris]MBX8995614.1 trimeric intracellular cation channel family protein [Corynebacterium testudinoris]
MDALDTAQLLTTLFIIGITAEAITAALAAGRQRMDLFGVIALAGLTALGGGTMRDVLLDHYPLAWVAEPRYLIIVVAAALTTVALSFIMHYFRKLFLLADAVGLAAFSVIGTQVALEMGHGFVIACVAAVVNGVSGGVLRDLMSDRVPLVFSKELYASISILATITYVSLLELGLGENWVIVITLITAFAVRVLAMYRGWSLPVFDYQGKDQPIDPRLRSSYRYMRRGIRRVSFDISRYSLLDRKKRPEGEKKQKWRRRDDPDQPAG